VKEEFDGIQINDHDDHVHEDEIQSRHVDHEKSNSVEFNQNLGEINLERSTLVIKDIREVQSININETKKEIV